jgi:hypothetical protein
MGIQWFDMIAKRNGGYKSDAVFTVEGISGEDVFEERLNDMLFIGFDGSKELLKIANS